MPFKSGGKCQNESVCIGFQLFRFACDRLPLNKNHKYIRKIKQKGIKLPPEGGQSMQEGKHVHCGELNPCRCVAAGSGRPPWHCAQSHISTFYSSVRLPMSEQIYTSVPKQPSSSKDNHGFDEVVEFKLG